MPTVIDALVVTLGLDLSQYRRGQRDADAAQRHTREEAGRTAKDIEARGKQSAMSLSRLRNEVVGLFAVVTAGRGVKDFVRDITASDAAAGRLATNLGISVESLSTWRGAAERAGGSAAGIDGTLSNLAAQFQQLKLTGQSSVLPYFRSLGVQFTGTEKDLDNLNLAVQGMNKQEALFKLRGAGIDPETAQLLLRTPQDLRRMREESARLAPVTKRNADNAEALRVGLVNLRDGATGLARELLSQFSPALIQAMDATKAWLIEHKPQIVKAITEAVGDLKDALARVPWADIKQGIKDFAGGADGVAQALGGWTRATEILFGLWLGARGLKFLAGVGSLFGLVRGGGAGGGLLGGLLRVLGMAGTAYAVTKAAKPGDWLDPSKDKPDPQAPPETPAEQGRGFWNRLYKGLTGMDPDPNGTGGTAGGRVAEAAPGVNKPLLDLIGKAEGTDKGRGYNETLAYGKFTGGPQELTKMTIGQIKQLQTQMLAHPANTMNSSAVGRYQITRTTLKDLQGQLGIGDDALYDEKMQDRLASHLIQTRARGSLYQQQAGLSSIWASFPHPDTGRGAYAGQHASIDLGRVNRALADVAANRGEGRVAAGIQERVDLARSAAPPPAASADAAGGGSVKRAQARDARLAEIGAAAADMRKAGATEAQVRETYEKAGRADLYRDPAGRPGWFNELPARGAPAAAAASGATTHHNDNRSENNVNGPITIHTQATDAQGIAGAMGGALRSRAFLPQANSGLA